MSQPIFQQITSLSFILQCCLLVALVFDRHDDREFKNVAWASSQYGQCEYYSPDLCKQISQVINEKQV